MAHNNKEKKTRKFRLALIDNSTHEQLWTIHFTRTTLTVTLVSMTILFSALLFSLIAFTPLRTFIPGYPDAMSKRAAIQNTIKIDSLERVIFRWELYSENLRRVVEGQEPYRIDSLIKLSHAHKADKEEMKRYLRQDSILRNEVQKEEQFGISARSKRDLPIEGRHFFTPLNGVISQGYDPALHPFIDITAKEGSVVKATLDGTVIHAGWNDETGYTIQIQHEGDIISIYKHNEKLLKGIGDKVTAGAPIALVGNSGSLSTGAHLHFELWHNGESVNPTRYINF